MHNLLGKTAIVVTASAAFLTFLGSYNLATITDETPPVQQQEFDEITGKIKKGETLFDIFKKNQLDISELYKMREASAGIHRLRELRPGHRYRIIRDNDEQINSFTYRIDDSFYLNVNRTDQGYVAEKIPIDYTKKMLHIGGSIKENLISSMGKGYENLQLALQLSDIFAWDIDFNTDLRDNDAYKIVVEGYYLEGKFRKYGQILAAEFMNHGKTYHAYAFEQGGKIEYYDETGGTLRKAFLKAPLSFRRISSNFSSGRYHPVLKIYRPHHGLDYAAATGTPVSAAGNGQVIFTGRRGQYGNLIIVKHQNGYKTYYGHLSKISQGVRKGTKVNQGEIIGYVGATGLATGPHLHYEVRIKDRPVNPLALKLPRGAVIPEQTLAAFNEIKGRMDGELASTEFSGNVAAEDVRDPARREES